MLNKDQARKKALACRQSLSILERKKRSTRIIREILSSSFFSRAECVMVYLNFRDEVETTSVAEEVLKRGKRLIIPYCETKNTQIIPCEIYDLNKDVAPGEFGIREPLPGSFRPISTDEIDLVLVPGIAFDYYGNRVGFGKGYYDRFLPKLRNNICIIGMAFACQVFEKIEAHSHDYKMSLLVTEQGVIIPR